MGYDEAWEFYTSSACYFGHTKRSLTEAERELFANSTRIRLSGECFTVLTGGMFLPSVRCVALYLDDNRIKEIRNRAFFGLSALRELYLRHNRLTALRAGMFIAIENLHVLEVGGNPITTIEPGTFAMLPHLTTIGLGGTLFKVLKAEYFDHLARPIELDLFSESEHVHEWDCSKMCWLKQEKRVGNISFYRNPKKRQMPSCEGTMTWAKLRCSETITCPERCVPEDWCLGPEDCLTEQRRNKC